MLFFSYVCWGVRTSGHGMINLIFSVLLFTHLSCLFSAGWPASSFSFFFYLFSRFPHHPPPPPLTLSGSSSVSLWSSPSTRRLGRPLIFCLRPAWTSPQPVTPNATRRPLIQATGTCGVSWHMRLSTLMVGSLRLPLGSMATTPTLTRLQPT